MVERQAIGGAAAAIVARDREPLEAERRHHRHLIARHGAFGIGRVIGGLGAVEAAFAIAAQIGANHGEFSGEMRRDLVPARMRLGIAVEQQQRRAGAADFEQDFGLLDCHPPRCEAGDHGGPVRAVTERGRNG